MMICRSAFSRAKTATSADPAAEEVSSKEHLALARDLRRAQFRAPPAFTFSRRHLLLLHLFLLPRLLWGSPQRGISPQPAISWRRPPGSPQGVLRPRQCISEVK